MDNITQIDINKIFPHPQNPRKNLGDLSELIESIKVNGLFQNLTVVPKPDGDPDEYLAVIGNRRLTASKKAGLSVLPCFISDMSHKQQVATMLAENLQRNDLTLIEQAEGFQMMLDLGESVNEIATSTGFSVTTVRKRVKLLELDRERLEKSVQRGATLDDIAKLETIKDPELRNKVLESIGTANFAYALKAAVNSEEEKVKRAVIITELNTFAEEIDESSTKNLSRIKWIQTSGNAEFEKPADADTRSYFYVIASYGYITLYAEPTSEETEKSAALLEANMKNQIKEAQLSQIAGRAFELRYDFIKNLNGIKALSAMIKNISAFAVFTMLSSGWNDSMDETIIAEMLGIELDEEDCFTFGSLADQLKSSPGRVLLVTAYANCGDSSRAKYHNWGGTYTENDDLDNLYKFLETFGYELSDEEKAYKDGTHELFANEDIAVAA